MPPAYPAFGLISCPLSPQPPSRRGRGRFFCFLMQGASPLASPAFNRLRHLQSLPLWYPKGGLPPALPSRQALAVPCGGLAPFAARLPCLWFAFLPPSPLPPFPAGKGGDFFVFLCKGLRPRHPCIKPFAAFIVFSAVVPGGGLAPSGTGCSCRCGVRREGVPALPPAYPAFGLISCPHPPNPLPQQGRGRILLYFAGGFAPGTPALNRLRHLQNLPSRCPTGGLPPALPSRRALTVPCGGLALFAARLPCL